MYHLEPDPIEQLNGADDREASEETHVAANLCIEIEISDEKQGRYFFFDYKLSIYFLKKSRFLSYFLLPPS